MATYDIKAPDGTVFEVTAPDNASEAEVLAYAQAQFKQQQPSAPPPVQQTQSPAPPPAQATGAPRNYALSEVPLAALQNAPASAGKLVSGLADMVMSPIETGKALGNLAMNKDDSWNKAKQALLARYGGTEEIKRTIAEDPVGVMSDFSTAALGASKLANVAKLGKAGSVLNTAANVTDPFRLAGKAISGAGDAMGKAGVGLTGLSTGVGRDVVREAFTAGRTGDPGSLLGNMRVQIPQHHLVMDARQNLNTLKTTRDADYTAGIAATAADTTPIAFAPIEAAFNAAVAPLTRGGKSLIGKAEARVIKEVEAAVAQWKNNPVPNTAIELDGLRRRLDAVYPKSPQHVQAQRVVAQVRDAVNATISGQSSTYAATMAGYADDTERLNELSKTLGLGRKQSNDAAIRKLVGSAQDTSINSAYRQNLLGQLEGIGPNQLSPGIAGQALSQWMPHGTMMRSTAGAVGSVAALGGLVAHPAALFGLGVLPLASPRIVGETMFKLGQTAKIFDAAGKAKAFLPRVNTVAQFANPQLED